MKKTILTAAITVFTLLSYSQDSVYIIKDYDAMNEKTYIYPNRGMVVANEDKTKGFRLSPFITQDFKVGMLTAVIVGVGSCHENNEIIILFEDGSKITKTSWNKFNCKGDSYFNLSDKDLDKLRTTKLSKIRITNGYSHESFTEDVKDSDKDYLIKILQQLDNKVFKTK
jgi:hypothetical protein